MSISTIDRLKEDLTANPDLIDEIITHNFDFRSFIEGAEKLGYGLSDEQIEAYLHDVFPSGGEGGALKFYAEDAETGRMRELSKDELALVGGGCIPVAIACIVIVAVAAYAYVAAVHTAAAAVAAAVAAVAMLHTSIA